MRRFFALRESVFRDPDSYFRHFAGLTDEQADMTARHIWSTINGRNLRENIEPTRERASLILRKADDHRVERGPAPQTLIRRRRRSGRPSRRRRRSGGRQPTPRPRRPG